MAPNPGLHISGIGPIGVPLSERDKEALQSCAMQGACGTEERSDKSVIDAWEVDGHLVCNIYP